VDLINKVALCIITNFGDFINKVAFCIKYHFVDRINKVALCIITNCVDLINKVALCIITNFVEMAGTIETKVLLLIRFCFPQHPLKVVSTLIVSKLHYCKLISTFDSLH